MLLAEPVTVICVPAMKLAVIKPLPLSEIVLVLAVKLIVLAVIVAAFELSWTVS